MNWNQYLQAERIECIKDTLLSLQSAMTDLDEAYEKLEDAMESIKSADLDSFEVKDVKTAIIDAQISLCHKIDTLEDYLDS